LGLGDMLGWWPVAAANVTHVPRNGQAGARKPGSIGSGFGSGPRRRAEVVEAPASAPGPGNRRRANSSCAGRAPAQPGAVDSWAKNFTGQLGAFGGKRGRSGPIPAEASRRPAVAVASPSTVELLSEGTRRLWAAANATRRHRARQSRGKRATGTRRARRDPTHARRGPLTGEASPRQRAAMALIRRTDGSGRKRLAERLGAHGPDRPDQRQYALRKGPACGIVAIRAGGASTTRWRAGTVLAWGSQHRRPARTRASRANTAKP